MSEAVPHLEGVLNVHKPAGISSYDVIRHIKKVLRGQGSVVRGEKITEPSPLTPKYSRLKIGHAGTLDPFATGVLLVLLGKATKKSNQWMDALKVYEGAIMLGQETDTADLTGKPVGNASSKIPAREAVEKAADKFVGEIDQVPPVYSALKYGGKPMYKLARKGVEVIPAARKVLVEEFKILDYRYPRIFFRARVGKGTYIRSLAVDLGRALGAGAHLETLCRVSIGEFLLPNAKTLEALSTTEQIRAALVE